MHAPWWHLPTLLSHNQLPCSNPVSPSARSIFEKQDGAFFRIKHHTLPGQPGGNIQRVDAWRGTTQPKTKWGASWL